MSEKLLAELLSNIQTQVIRLEEVMRGFDIGLDTLRSKVVELSRFQKDQSVRNKNVCKLIEDIINGEIKR